MLSEYSSALLRHLFQSRKQMVEPVLTGEGEHFHPSIGPDLELQASSKPLVSIP